MRAIPFGRRLCVLFAILTVVGALSPLPATSQGNSVNAHACRKGGWQTQARAESWAVPFADQGACVRYGAQGGDVVALRFPSVVLDFFEDGNCVARLSVTDYQPGTYTVKYSGFSAVSSLEVGTDGTGVADSLHTSGGAIRWVEGATVTAYIDGAAVATEDVSCPE